MDKEKDSFVFYKSFYDAIKSLKSSERLQMYDAICELGINNNELQLSGHNKSLITLIKPQILANNKRYEDGKKGGRPKKGGFENAD